MRTPHDGGSINKDSSSRFEGKEGEFANSCVSNWELRLVMEYCDKGTLRDGLDEGLLGELNGSGGLTAVPDHIIIGEAPGWGVHGM